MIAKLGRPVIRHLSELAHESLKQPGNWRCLEIVYRNEPNTLLDRFFLSSRSARGARNRLQALQDEICKCIQRYSRIHNPVKLISLGSGPGHEILGSLKRIRENVAIEATCIDRDSSALECGKCLAAQKGLSDRVKYIQGNILRMDSTIAKYDIAILSGLIDYFDFEMAVSVLKIVRNQLVPCGTILIANMRRHYLASIMSILGDWHLAYREPEEVEGILAESGYEGIEVWLESEEVFCIGKAIKPN